MAALTLTTKQKAILDGVDSKLDQQFTDGTENPDTSVNTAAMNGYTTLDTSFKDLARGIFRQCIAALLGALEDWTEVVGGVGFQNSYTNTGSFWETAGFYKDPLGRVYLKGRVGGGAANTAIFSLPAGYRPKSGKALSFAVTANGAFQEVRINDSGDIFVPSGSTTGISLDGINFRAEG